MTRFPTLTILAALACAQVAACARPSSSSSEVRFTNLDAYPEGTYFNQSVSSYHYVHRQPRTTLVDSTLPPQPWAIAPEDQSAPASADCPDDVSASVCADWQRHRLRSR